MVLIYVYSETRNHFLVEYSVVYRIIKGEGKKCKSHQRLIISLIVSLYFTICVKLYRVVPSHLTQTYQPLSIGTSMLPNIGPLTTTTPALETVLLAPGQQSRLQPKGRIMPAIPGMINAQQDIDCE